LRKLNVLTPLTCYTLRRNTARIIYGTRFK